MLSAQRPQNYSSDLLAERGPTYGVFVDHISLRNARRVGRFEVLRQRAYSTISGIVALDSAIASLEEDVVYWATHVEAISTLARRVREDELDAAGE